MADKPVLSPIGRGMGEAPEEREAEVFDGVGEVVALGEGFLHGARLLVRKLFVPRRGTRHDLPVQPDERGRAPLHADEQRGVGLLQIVVEPLDAREVAVPRLVVDRLRLNLVQPVQGVEADEPVVGLARGGGEV